MYLGMIIAAFLLFLVPAIRGRTFRAVDHEGIPNTLSFVKLVSTLLATAVGGGLIFGLMQFGQHAGTIGLLLAVVYCLSFVALGTLAPGIRRFCQGMQARGYINDGENLSLPLILARKYSAGVWGLVVLGYGIVYCGFLAAQYVAIGQIIQGMGVDLSESELVIASAVVVLAYVSIGGFRAVVDTDVIQLGIIFLVLAIGGWLVFSHGVPDLSVLPDSYWNPFASSSTASNFVWLAVFIFPTLLLRLDHWQRIVTAKNDKVALLGYITSGLGLVAVFLVLLFVGVSSRLAGSEAPLWIYQDGLRDSGSTVGSVLYGVALVALLCAVMSSADTILNSISAFIAQSMKAWRLFRSDSAMPAIVMNVIVTLGALLLTLRNPNVVPLITEAFKLLTILLPSIVAGLALRVPSGPAAVVSIVAGATAYGVTKGLWEAASDWAFVIGFLASVVSLCVVYGLENSRARVERRRASELPSRTKTIGTSEAECQKVD